MRFFSKIVTFCNIAFVLSVVMRIVQFTSTVKANPNTVEQTNIVISTIIILGTFAFLLNILFVIALIYFKLRKKENNIPAALVFANAILLPIQIWYFF